MRCCHCGKRIPDTKEICPYCGHLQLEVEVRQANSRRISTALLVVLAVVLLAGGIAFYLLSGSSILKPPTPTPDPLDELMVSVAPSSTAAPKEESAAETTEQPTTAPTAEPTAEPTAKPTAEPTARPTLESTARPTAEPTARPTAEPTAKPTAEPTAKPTAEPTAKPTAEPTAKPTPEPTVEPTAEPAAEPTPEPTAEPTPVPTERPHPGEHDLAGMRRPLVFPQSDSWLSDYETVYVQPGGEGVAIFLLNSPTNLNFIMGLVFKGYPQTALARENGHTLLRTNDGRIGWVKSYLLSEGTVQIREPVAAPPVSETVNTPEESALPQTEASPELPEPLEQNTEASGETTGIGDAISSALGNVFSNVSDALATTYIADIGNAIFHEPDCAKVGEISTVNRWENMKTRDELIRLGYEPCPVCKP